MATSAGLYRATRAIRFASCCAIRRLARLVTVVSGVRTRGGLAWLVAMAEPSFSAVLVEHVQKAERLVDPFAPAPGPPGRAIWPRGGLDTDRPENAGTGSWRVRGGGFWREGARPASST